MSSWNFLSAIIREGSDIGLISVVGLWTSSYSQKVILDHGRKQTQGSYGFRS